jgi:hypothetical protein
MTSAKSATPRVSVRLYKTISRRTVDGNSAASARYQGKDAYIDLTPYLNDRSAVRTQKSTREPAGSFTVTFADRPNESFGGGGYALESVYGLVEPMDIVEIRMWGGTGPSPAVLPIVMRGFVSEVQRTVGMGDGGQPQRQVVVSGQDYGKIWQMFQVSYLRAYFERQGLLTNFAIWELFGVEVKSNSSPAGDFIRVMVEKIINKYIREFVPKNLPEQWQRIQTGESISVKHGRVNNSYQSMEGSFYEIMRFHGDVGVWNELYTEDREDGVHCVYRAIPALHLTAPNGDGNRKIQDDAPDPVYVDVPDALILSLNVARGDANVANFFWVNNERFDLIDDMQRKLASLAEDDASVSLKEYPNTAVKYYGTRTMNAATQQAGDDVPNTTSGLGADEVGPRLAKQEEWITRRRRLMVEMNRDNVVLERGTARIKGGLQRSDGTGLLRAGDYIRVLMGGLTYEAYVVQVEHEFLAFNSYTTTVMFERGTGFAERVRGEFGATSPWLLEQARRGIL